MTTGVASPDGESALRVDFYVLDDPQPSGRLRLACKLAEKAYLAEQSVLIWHSQIDELKALDDLLWTFRDGSFIPHELLAGESPAGDAPILLSSGAPPPESVDVLINLAADLPAHLDRTRRVIEIIDGDEARRRAGRARFKAYRDRGLQPASHNIRSE